eukprot:CAMPEP_0113549828 /NCGR_PEP_ID=MMETSP0015_2-20120614/13653_1 /TAXON_ID=2838 /ORGANISM="Odontella" /LENGTH=402 /DNA_ID=CAMNT_0000450587 /DNA_START=1 /DNA_END=1209 /DNA_ORIENTATION=+ /assembly_acc=CAM_ASM_000160
MLSDNSTLTSLNLNANAIDDAGGDLDLCANNIGPNGARALAGMLSDNSTLTSLNLNANAIDDAGGDLDLCANNIDPDGARALAGMLSDNSTLTSLNLNANAIDDAGGAALADSLRTNSALTSLNLSGNYVGDAGSTALAGMLSDNSTLTKLDLSDNRFGVAGATAFADSLRTNSTLTSLNLSHNDISDAGVTSFADALHTNSTLTYLGLYSDNITDFIQNNKFWELTKINARTNSREGARRQKIILRIKWMVNAEDEDEAGAQYEEAVVLALEEMGSLPKPKHRRELFRTRLGTRQELFRTLLGTTEHGEDVAASVETVPRGRALYRYAADCGAAPAVLMKILRAHPTLCGTCRDVEHKLYPFMLLATLPDAEVGDVMELLLQCPSLVASGIGEPIGRGKSK